MNVIHENVINDVNSQIHANFKWKVQVDVMLFWIKAKMLDNSLKNIIRVYGSAKVKSRHQKYRMASICAFLFIHKFSIHQFYLFVTLKTSSRAEASIRTEALFRQRLLFGQRILFGQRLLFFCKNQYSVGYVPFPF